VAKQTTDLVLVVTVAGSEVARARASLVVPPSGAELPEEILAGQVRQKVLSLAPTLQVRGLAKQFAALAAEAAEEQQP